MTITTTSVRMYDNTGSTVPEITSRPEGFGRLPVTLSLQVVIQARRGDGVARVCLENIAAMDGSLMVFEIHKLGTKGFLWTKAFWVVQLYSASDASGPLKKRGCVWGKTCVSAIHEAHIDVKYGFMSIADFEMASRVPA